MKQKLRALAERLLRRYRTSNERKQQNSKLQRSEKQFYNQLREGTTNIQEAPTEEEIEIYWSGPWTKNKVQTEGKEWFKVVNTEVASIQEINDTKISIEEPQKVIKKIQCWKAPGPDKIQNFWYKETKLTHTIILKAMNKYIQEPNSIPRFITQAYTYLKLKTQNITNPRVTIYRSIICLTTI